MKTDSLSAKRTGLLMAVLAERQGGPSLSASQT